jgi:hypothetical protein
MVGIVILIVGVIAVIYANYQKGRIANAEGNIKKGESFFSGAAGSAVGGAMEGKVSSYKAPVMMLMIGGIVLVVIGGGMALFCGKKRKR